MKKTTITVSALTLVSALSFAQAPVPVSCLTGDVPYMAKINCPSLIAFSQLPTPAASKNLVVWVRDCESPTTCSVGGGSNKLQLSSDGTSWTLLQSSVPAITAAGPYLTIGGTKYVAGTMWPFVPFFGGSYLTNTSNAFTSMTAGANGSEQIVNANGTDVWYGTSATTSIEAEFIAIGGQASTSNLQSISLAAGLWITDGSHLWRFVLTDASQNIAFPGLSVDTYTYTGSTPPQYVQNQSFNPLLGSSTLAHLKLSIVSGTVTAQYSIDGGQTYVTTFTAAAGTPSKAGVYVGGTAAAVGNFLSVKVI